MKRIYFFSSFLFFLFFIAGCSNKKSADEKKDSAIENPSIDKTTLQTDSGRLEIEKVAGSPEAKALLYDEKGNVIQKGMMIDNKPAGAWLKFDSNGKILSAEQYSNGKPSHVLDKNDFYFRNYQNEGMNVQFKVPLIWKEIKSANPALLCSFEKEDNDKTVLIKPNFNVVRAQLNAGDSLQKLAQMQIDLMHQNFGRVDIIDENLIVIDSLPAFRRYGMYGLENNNVGFLNVIILKGNIAWFFSCEAQNKNGDFVKYQGVFQQIVESFQTLH